MTQLGRIMLAVLQARFTVSLARLLLAAVIVALVLVLLTETAKAVQ